MLNESRLCGVKGSAKLVSRYCGKAKSNPKSNSKSNSNSHSNDNSNGGISNVINVFQVSGNDIEDVSVSTGINTGINGNNGSNANNSSDGNNGGNNGGNQCNLNQGPPPLEPVEDSSSRIQWTDFMVAALYRIMKGIADTGKINGKRLHGVANLTNGEWQLIHARFEHDTGMIIDIKKVQGKRNRTVSAQGKTRSPKLHALMAPVWEEISAQLSKSTSSNSYVFLCEFKLWICTCYLRIV